MDKPTFSRPTTTLSHPVGQKELDLIAASEQAAFAPRLEWQPIFYPVLTEDYAIRIARDWNTKDEASGYIGYVLEFEVAQSDLARFSHTKLDVASFGNFGSEQRNSTISTDTLQ